MKTRENYPFIYFFFEPNIVFVYKIESQNYLTVWELSKRGEWQTYVLEPTEDFDTFDHEKSNPLEGRGYMIRMDDKNLMGEKINQLIQKQRKRLQDGKIVVHITSSAAVAGSLRYGLDRPKTVIGFDGFFSIGPVWRLDSKIGQTNRNEWLHDHINFEMNDFEYENRFANTLLEIEDIPNEAPIYIWAAENGDEQTGLRFVLHLLSKKPNEVYLINPTKLHVKWLATKEVQQTILHTGELLPEQLQFLFEKSKAAMPLSAEERLQFQQDWAALAESKGMLRLWLNERVEEIPEDYYDSLILKTIEELHGEQEQKDFIRTGRVIGEVITKMEEIVGDSFLEYRIRHLVYSGVLELKGIPKSMRHYRVKLRDR